jgi:hypothetical protein
VWGSGSRAGEPGPHWSESASEQRIQVDPPGGLGLQIEHHLRPPAQNRLRQTRAVFGDVASDMLGREVAEHELGTALLDPGIGSDAVAPPLTAREIHAREELRRAVT